MIFIFISRRVKDLITKRGASNQKFRISSRDKLAILVLIYFFTLCLTLINLSKGNRGDILSSMKKVDEDYSKQAKEEAKGLDNRERVINEEERPWTRWNLSYSYLSPVAFLSAAIATLIAAARRPSSIRELLSRAKDLFTKKSLFPNKIKNSTTVSSQQIPSAKLYLVKNKTPSFELDNRIPRKFYYKSLKDNLKYGYKPRMSFLKPTFIPIRIVQKLTPRYFLKADINLDSKKKLQDVIEEAREDFVMRNNLIFLSYGVDKIQLRFDLLKKRISAYTSSGDATNSVSRYLKFLVEMETYSSYSISSIVRLRHEIDDMKADLENMEIEREKLHSIVKEIEGSHELKNRLDSRLEELKEEIKKEKLVLEGYENECSSENIKKMREIGQNLLQEEKIEVINNVNPSEVDVQYDKNLNDKTKKISKGIENGLNEMEQDKEEVIEHHDKNRIEVSSHNENKTEKPNNELDVLMESQDKKKLKEYNDEEEDLNKEREILNRAITYGSQVMEEDYRVINYGSKVIEREISIQERIKNIDRLIEESKERDRKVKQLIAIAKNRALSEEETEATNKAINRWHK